MDPKRSVALLSLFYVQGAGPSGTLLSCHCTLKIKDKQRAGPSPYDSKAPVSKIVGHLTFGPFTWGTLKIKDKQRKQSPKRSGALLYVPGDVQKSVKKFDII